MVVRSPGHILVEGTHLRNHRKRSGRRKESENKRRERNIFCKCMIWNERWNKKGKERKWFHGAWMRWHESSALWVLLAWGKPVEQKDRDGRVCALPQHTCTQRMRHICSRASHKQHVVIFFFSFWFDKHCSRYNITLWNPAKQQFKWLISNNSFLGVLLLHRMWLHSDDDHACLIGGMSAGLILYKRVRWEERCRLGCKCSVGRLGPVLAALHFTERQTCE